MEREIELLKDSRKIERNRKIETNRKIERQIERQRDK
jgi:hypothetical protein